MHLTLTKIWSGFLNPLRKKDEQENFHRTVGQDLPAGGTGPAGRNACCTAAGEPRPRVCGKLSMWKLQKA